MADAVTLSPLLPFVLAVLAMELTPGPNMGYLAIVAARSGRRAGMAVVAGVTLGLLAYLLAAVAGIAQAAARLPWLYPGLRWAGVAYLSWLAWDAWRGVGVGAEVATPRGYGRLFTRGLVANLLNPKAALLYVVLLPGFISPEGHPAAQALSLGAIHLAVALAVHSAIVLSAGGLQPILSGQAPRRALLLGRAMAVAMAGVAVWMAVSTA